MVIEDEFLMARSLAALLKAWGTTILGPAATTERALSLLARASRVDFALIEVNLRGATAFAAVEAPVARRVAFAFTTGYGASPILERYRDAAVHQKPFGKIEIAKFASALVLPASRP
jgi:DNA-binding NarL/FixJ family response regulator